MRRLLKNVSIRSHPYHTIDDHAVTASKASYFIYVLIIRILFFSVVELLWEVLAASIVPSPPLDLD